MLSFLQRAVLALALAFAAPAAAKVIDTGHIEAELVAQEAGAIPGGTVFVAVRQKIDKGWHTYWRNAGDSGDATKIAWTLPQGWKAGDIVWPTPTLQPAGPLMNYGYSGEVLLPVPIEVPADAKGTVELKAAVAFLVCADICIPEDAVLTLSLPVAQQPGHDPKWGERLTQALAAAPKAAGLAAAFRREGEAVKLAVTGAPLKGADVSGAYFFPYSGKVIVHRDAQQIARGPDGLTLTLSPGFDFTEGTPPAEIAGVLALKGAAYEITAAEGPSPPGASGLGAPQAAPRKGGLPLALLLALAGGLVLNLMPCVFPILSMKAAALAGHAHEARGARLQGLAFLAGVLATFLALAGLLIALKAAGGAVGWGFQLQSPAVVAALSLIMLLVALNLSGVFEVGTSIQGAGGSLASREGLIGSFFTGTLAVVVAAPCTAPFMASAIGYAMTRSAVEALTIFGVLGLGLALPYVALSFAPGLLRRLPPPGPWMSVLRKGLAFPMYGAAAWLLWVLTQQAGSIGVARLLAAGVGVAFAAWLFGVGQRRNDAWMRFTLMGLALAGWLAAFAAVAIAPYDARAKAEAPETAVLPYEAWSAERLVELRAEGRPVFVNFTAAWCVTCQVNEQVALATPGVADAFERTGAAYLKADWTNRDAAIAGALAEHDRAGVPLYLMYGRDGSVAILPQLLTEGMVAEALKTAARPAASAAR